MKKTSAFLSLFLSIALYGNGLELLSKEKKEILLEEQKRSLFEHEKLKHEWIAPINLNSSLTYDKSAATEEIRTKKISASITQDIFKSGGIEHQEAYADAKALSDKIALEMEIASLNKELFLALLNYKKTLLQKEQSELNLKNKEIEIFIKRQLYSVGKVDITELNSALMSQSSELKNLSTHNYTLSQLKLEISKLSDINPDTFKFNDFTLMQEDEYLKKSLDLSHVSSLALKNEKLYEISKSSYLPHISINVNSGYQNIEAKISNDYDGAFYGVGVSLNMPLSFNSSATIQEAKALYLKEAANRVDKTKISKISYAQSLELIWNYYSLIDIVKKNLTLYDELIKTIKAGFEAGVKTGYDLQTMKNSKAIEELDIKINKVNIQLELAKLHYY